MENKEVKCVVRYNGDKMQLKWDHLEHELTALLDKIQ